jgi:hypothetical protein
VLVLSIAAFPAANTKPPAKRMSPMPNPMNQDLDLFPKSDFGCSCIFFFIHFLNLASFVKKPAVLLPAFFSLFN